MAGLDATIITIAIPRLAMDFGVSPVSLGLSIVAYILAFTVLLPASSWVADRFSTKYVFVGAMTAFTLTSVLCGISDSYWMFIAARTLQGASAAMMTPIGGLVLLRSVEKADLVTAMAISSTAGLMAPVIGPPLGGVIVGTLGWPFMFYLNIPLGVIGGILVLRCVPEVRHENAGTFDLTGFILSAVSMSALIYGLDSFGTPGNRWQESAILVVGGCMTGIALIAHSRRTLHPLIDFRTLRISTFREMLLGGGGVVKIPYRGMGFALPLLLQIGLGLSAVETGLLLLAYNGGDVALKPFANRLLIRSGFRSSFVTGSVLTTASTLGLLAVNNDVPFWLLWLGLFAAGMTRSVMLTGVVALTFADVEKPDLASASLLNNIMNQITGAMGVSIVVILIGASAHVLGSSSSGFGLAECRVAVLGMAVLSVCALLLFLRLPRDTGEAIIGEVPSQPGALQHRKSM